MFRKSDLTTKQMKRRDQIIEAAVLVYGRDSDLNLDKIIKISGGSKGAIYDFFGDKDGLQRSVNEEIFSRIHILIGSLIERLNGLSGEQGLETVEFADFVSLLMKTFSDPKAGQSIRLLFLNFHSQSELARQFYEEGPLTCVAGLEDFLMQVAASKGVTLDDPHKYASILFGMISAHYLCESIFGMRRSKMTDAEIKEHTELLVDIFQHGFLEAVSRRKMLV